MCRMSTKCLIRQSRPAPNHRVRWKTSSTAIASEHWLIPLDTCGAYLRIKKTCRWRRCSVAWRPCRSRLRKSTLNFPTPLYRRKPGEGWENVSYLNIWSGRRTRAYVDHSGDCCGSDRCGHRFAVAIGKVRTGCGISGARVYFELARRKECELERLPRKVGGALLLSEGLYQWLHS